MADPDPSSITPENWNKEPWPEELALFVQCRTPRWPTSGEQLACTDKNIWAGKFKRTGPRKCAWCLGDIQPESIGIKVLFEEYKPKWLHVDRNICDERLKVCTR